MHLFKIILLIWDMNIKLTKKEKDFLSNWLLDDLDIAQKNYHNSSKTIIKMLLSIIKKLTTKQRSKNGI